MGLSSPRPDASQVPHKRGPDVKDRCEYTTCTSQIADEGQSCGFGVGGDKHFTLN